MLDFQNMNASNAAGTQVQKPAQAPVSDGRKSGGSFFSMTDPYRGQRPADDRTKETPKR